MTRFGRPLLLAFAALVAAVFAGACGFSEETSGGGTTVSWYVFNEPGGAFEEAAKRCSDESGGKYTIRYVRLPTNADQQRELVVRRLAAKDSDIDIVGMDVIWTAEFAEAGWIKEWTGDRRSQASAGVLEGPLRTAQYQDKLWAAPFTTNTQLLWYRKDRVEEPPETWDEMISQAEELDTKIEVQAARYEGLTVWINSLIASAGGQIVDEQGNVKVDDTAKKAAEIIQRLAVSSAAPPGLSNLREDPARLGFESGRSSFQVNYTFVYASAAGLGDKEFLKNFGWARWPGVNKGEPSKVTLGGINLGVGAYSKNPDLAFDAALCLRGEANQITAAEKGGLPPSSETLYDDPKIEKAFPFADVLKETLADGAPRPVNPAYSDISLAIQKTFHPPEEIEPDKIVEKLKERLDTAAEGGLF